MAGIKGRPTDLKKVNTTLISDALHKLGQATRVELSAYTGLSQPTVNAIVGDLLSTGAIAVLGYAEPNGGRPAQIYRINLNKNCVVAVLAFGGALCAHLVNAGGDVLIRRDFPLNDSARAHNGLLSLLDELTASEYNVRAIGVGVPGAVSHDGTLFAIPQLPAWENLSLREQLINRYKIPVLLQNDTNAMAFGYYQSVPHHKVRDVAFIHIGQGIGAGLVVNGKVVQGFSSFAGEISYMFTGETGQSRGRGPFEIQYQNAKSVKEQSGVVARMAANIICILNPPVLVFSGDGATEELISGVRGHLLSYVPENTVPRLRLVSDENKYYIAGLARLAQQMADTDMKLVGGQ